MKRHYEYEIMDVIKRRWSPRGFDPDKKLVDEDIYPLIEAANYAPSAFNSQPRRFIIATSDERRAKVFSALDEGNQSWTHLVPAFVVFVVEKIDAKGRNMRWGEFDTGTSFGLFALEAVERGMHSHAMGGFDPEKIKVEFDLAEGLEPIAVVAVGFYGDKRDLPEHYQEKENPNTRKPIQEMIL